MLLNYKSWRLGLLTFLTFYISGVNAQTIDKDDLKEKNSETLQFDSTFRNSIFEAKAVKTIDLKLEDENEIGNAFFSEVNSSDYTSTSNPTDTMFSSGPDNFGYQWESSYDSSAQVNFTDISNDPLATNLNLFGYDYETVTLPWSFPFYDSTYTEIHVYSVGVIKFTFSFIYVSNGFSGTPPAFPNNDNPNNAIAPFWDNMNANGNIWYYESLDGEKVIIQWEESQICCDPTNPKNTFQVILWQNGTIEFQYEEVNDSNVTATIGIENYAGNDGLQVANDEPFLKDSLGVIFFADSSPIISHSPLKNTTNTSNNYTITAHVLDTGSINFTELYWRTNSSSSFTVQSMLNVGGTIYQTQIPAQANGTTIQYYIRTEDNDLNETLHPSNAPNEFHNFIVSATLPPENLYAFSNIDLEVPLIWEIPNSNVTPPIAPINSFAYTKVGNSQIGFNGAEGMFATKFSLSKTQGLSKIKLRFLENEISNYTVSLYDVGRGGKPNQFLGVIGQGQTEGFEEEVELSLENPSQIAEGSFFVVISQDSENSFALASETENEIPANTFFVSGKGFENWQSFESVSINKIPQITIKTESLTHENKFIPERQNPKLKLSEQDLRESQNITSYLSFNKPKNSQVKAISVARFLSKGINFSGKKTGNQILSLGLSAFKIYRSTNPTDLVSPTNNFLIYESPDAMVLSYLDNDPSLVNGTEYFYAGTSVFIDSVSGQVIESSPSNLASATPLDVIPTQAPTNFSAILNGSLVDLAWTNPTLNVDSTTVDDLIGARIYRRDNAQQNGFVLYDSVAAPNETYTDVNPPIDATYYVVAVDLGGNESQRTNTANTFYIAGLGTPIFEDSLESPSNWTFFNNDPSVIWNVDATPSNVQGTAIPYSGNACLNYNNGVDFSSFGSPNSGSVVLNQTIDLTGVVSPNLFFWTLYESEFGSNYDQKWVEISTDNFQTTILDTQLFVLNINSGTWVPTVIALDSSWQQIQLRFRFDSIDGIGNGGAGWFIDNLGIYTTADLIGPVFANETQIGKTDDFTNHQVIQVSVSDPSGIDSVWLNYRVGNTGNFTTKAMSFSGGNTYIDSIPPPTNLTSDTVWYFFKANDLSDSLNTSHSPSNYLNNPNSNLHFYVVRLLPSGTLTFEPTPGNIHLEWGIPGANGIELKRDDGTSEFQSPIPSSLPGLNNPSPSTFATKFDISSQTQISGNAQVSSVKIFFANGGSAGAEFKVKIYSADPITLLPDVVLWDTLATQSIFGNFILFDLPTPVNVGNGLFFVGVEQTTTNQISLGGDTTFQLPYGFNNNTHFIQGFQTSWSATELLSPIYGQVIPMIRCFVEPVTTPIASSKANKITFESLNFKGKSKSVSKVNLLSQKDSNQIFENPSYTVLEYNLYKMNGSANDANEVVTNGSVIYVGTDLFFDDTNVLPLNLYSYAITVTYDVNGLNAFSEPGNLVIGTPLPNGGFLLANTLDFGGIPENTSETKDFVIHNIGNLDVNVSAMNFSTPFTLSSTSPLAPPFTITAFDSVTISVSCSLSNIGVETGTVDIVNDSPLSPYSVSLVAEGINPQISVNSPLIDFGVLGLGSADSVFASISVTNDGTTDLVISGFNFSGSNPTFFANTNQLPITISANQTSQVDFVFLLGTVQNPSIFSTNLEIESNALNTLGVINLLANVQVVSIGESENLIPTEFSLQQNYPNPFNPTTTIRFGIPQRSFTKIVIYNALGQKVKILVNKTLEASYYNLKWNGIDENGNTVSSGIYFVKIESGDFSQVKKMTFLK
ncbi:MAG: T9SS C-terminal target domain-containing protein [Calditrichaeota bacterium]|nr:MAG: T9SS C-terminal target domain-containing protein [Calditrichota bacterium]